VIVSQLLLLAADQVQPAPAVTATVPVLAPAPGDTLDGEIVYEQPAAWLTVNVRPAIVSEPLRAAPELAATL
jgi:hypothetical protein